MTDAARAVFFDLDDTLRSLREYSLLRLKAAARHAEARYPHLEQGAFGLRLAQLYDEGFRSDCLERALKEIGMFSKTLLAELVDVYRRTVSRGSLHPDSLPVLELLAARGTPAFLVTDGEPEARRAKEAGLELVGLFAEIVITGERDKDYHRPNPDLYLELCERHNLAPERCAAVGDNPYRDFVGLKRHGLTTLRIRRPDGRYAGVTLDEDHEAAFELASPREAFFHLERLRA